MPITGITMFRPTGIGAAGIQVIGASIGANTPGTSPPIGNGNTNEIRPVGARQGQRQILQMRTRQAAHGHWKQVLTA